MKAHPALSICIPVYNSHPGNLFMSILQQLPQLPNDTEVLVADDGSDEEYCQANRSFCQKHNLNYHQETHNRGRAAIRNILAHCARGEWLLFLDGDVQIPDTYYLKNYFSYRLNKGVVCGGVHYQNPPPEGCEMRFRYALLRECKTAGERQKKPWQGFKTNNFLVHRQVFKQVLFNESLTEYGHEDTLFGLQLKEKGIAVKHVNLPTHHPVTDTNTAFLTKAETALRNLHQIAQQYPQYRRYFKIYQLGRYLRNTGLSGLFMRWASMRSTQWKSKVLDGSASLQEFDLYRLYLLLKGWPRPR